MNYNEYKTLLFDCDGVILNSNKVKTKAFYKAALSYGHKSAQALVDYHILNGGISRYAKFKLFLEEMVPDGAIGDSLEVMLQRYSEEVREGLLTCEIAHGLNELRHQSSQCKWLIVSGGDQNELRDIFKQRGLDQLFDGGIFGSPTTKDEIMRRESLSGNIELPAIFYGDSAYDYRVSHQFGIDFTFVYNWSEIKDWKTFCQSVNCKYVKELGDLCMI